MATVNRFPPGAIIVVSGELSRFPAFTVSLARQMQPTGSTVFWMTGVSIAHNLNKGITKGMEQGFQWFWLLGDDHVFPPDLLLRLLAHQLPCVAPLCVYRRKPFFPIVFRERRTNGTFVPWQPSEGLPTTGVHEVAACSGAGMLIQRQVFEKMSEPWFEVGQIGTQYLCDDVYFQGKAADLGFPMAVDFDSAIGHITPMALWPVRQTEGGWGIYVDATAGFPDSEDEPDFFPTTDGMEYARECCDNYAIFRRRFQL